MVSFLIYIYVAMWPLFNQYILVDLGSGIPDITPQILIVPGLALMVFLRTSRAEFGGFFVWMILYLLYALLSSVFVSSVPSVIGVVQLLVQTYFLPYLIYFVIYNSRNKLNFKLLALANIAGASIIAGVGIAEFIAGQNLIGKVDYDVTRAITLYRTNGPFHDSIGYAALLLPYISYIFYCKQKQLISGKLSVISSLLISFGSFINFSRAAILGLLVTLVSCYAKRKVLVVLVVLSVIAVPIVVILSDIILSVLSSGAVQQRTDAATMAQRWELYKTVLDMIYESPISGIGYGNFVRVYGGGTHNSFLQVMVETGIIGFILFVMFVASLSLDNFKRVLSLSDSVEIRTRLGIIFVVFFISNTVTLLHSPHFLTALMIILASINAYYSQDQKDDKEVENVKVVKDVTYNRRILKMKNEK